MKSLLIAFHVYKHSQDAEIAYWIAKPALKRIAVAILTLILLAFSLTACGNDNQDPCLVGDLKTYYQDVCADYEPVFYVGETICRESDLPSDCNQKNACNDTLGGTYSVFDQSCLVD